MGKKSGQKLKVGIISLTSCEGCQFAIMDLGEVFLRLIQEIDLIKFRLFEEKEFVVPKLDLCFIEGSVVTPENQVLIMEVRRQSAVVVALGNCAGLGGVHQIKNFHQPNVLIKEIYRQSDKIPNAEIKKISQIIKVDYVLPGCPINNLEFLKLIYSVQRRIDYRIRPRPVCEECQLRGYDCVLMDKEGKHGQMCFGPVILGGCDAVCLKSAMPCQGCRGFFNGAPKDNHLQHLKNMGFTAEEINHQLEIYGLRGELEAKEQSSS